MKPSNADMREFHQGQREAEARSTLRGLEEYFDLCSAAKRAGETLDKAIEEVEDAIAGHPEIRLRALQALICEARRHVWITNNNVGYLGAK